MGKGKQPAKKQTAKADQFTPEQQETIIELKKQGFGVRRIGREIGVDYHHVHVFLQNIGIKSDTSQTAEATARRISILRQKRLDTAEQLMEDIGKLRERMFDTYQFFVPGETGSVLVELDEPPLKEQSDVAKAIRLHIQSIDDLLDGMETDKSANSKNVLKDIADGLKTMFDKNPDKGLGGRDYDG